MLKILSKLERYMKKTIIIFTVLLLTFVIFGEGLNSYASFIKNNYPVEYENTIKKYAVGEWKKDYPMIVYEINTQAEALTILVKNFERTICQSTEIQKS